MPILGADLPVIFYDEAQFSRADLLGSGLAVYFSDFGLAASRTAVTSATMGGDRTRHAPGAGNLAITGSLGLELSPTNAAYWLRHLLGAVQVAGGDGAPWVVTHAPGALPTGLRLERDWRAAGIADRVEVFAGCRVAAATLDLPQEGAVTLALDLVGRDYALEAAPAAAGALDLEHVGWFASDASLSLDGVPAARVKTFSLTVDNGLDTTRYTLGTGGRRVDLPEGFCSVSGQFTALVDTDLFAACLEPALDRTPVSLALDLAHGAGDGTAANERLVVTLDPVLLELASPAIASPNGLEVTVNFTAYRATAPGLAIALSTPLTPGERLYEAGGDPLSDSDLNPLFALPG